jgi:tetratricopeptide (TPR) repeat protein
MELLGQPARGQSVGVWQAPPDLLRELATEYRRVAEQAVRQGDFRRAAYIYGKLLGEDRLAAGALQRGGLHRDAALLYLKKVHDQAAAAQAFEAAGEVDRAITLYRQLGQHETAGDLLRRIGAEDEAIAEYARAAELRASAVPPDFYHAGLLFLQKARHPDQALASFQMGWERRPGGNAIPCAAELARFYSERGQIGPIRTLLDQGDRFFESSGSDTEAASFYNLIASLIAGSPGLAPHAEEVRDRALRAFAQRLRPRPGGTRRVAPLISTMLNEPALWPPALVADAEFAAATAWSRSRTTGSAAIRNPRVQGIHIGRGTVTAVCQASNSGELFIGFASGVVLGFRPGRSQIARIAEGSGPVTALAVDPEGQVIVSLRQTEQGTAISCTQRRPDGTFRTWPDNEIPGLSESWLTPVLPWGGDYLVGIGRGADLLIIHALSGLHWGGLTLASSAEDPPRAAILLPIGSSHGNREDRFVILTHDGPRWIVIDPPRGIDPSTGHSWRPVVGGSRSLRGVPYAWRPAVRPSSSLRSVPMTWRHFPPFLELVGLDSNGAVYAGQFFVEDDVLELVGSQVATTEGGYLAATRCATSTVVAVSASRTDWLSFSGDRFQATHRIELALPATVACFRSVSPQEVLAVCSDGFVARITQRRANY